MLAGTFLLVWVVLASMNRLVYDNAAADEDKHGFGNTYEPLVRVVYGTKQKGDPAGKKYVTRRRPH